MAENAIINVNLFGREIGRLGLDEKRMRSSFQFSPDFLNSGDLSKIFPATGIIKRIPYVQLFSDYQNETFKGLPPQFADSLPDVFGSIIFKTWLEERGESDITVLEQLAYVANRGMGALEFSPSKELPKVTSIDLDEVISVLQEVLDLKKRSKQQRVDNEALVNIFKIGSSAGGARPKVLISEHKENRTIIPGDLEYSEAYHHYLVKLAFEVDGYPREIVEYCYYKIARNVGIRMMESKLIDNRHFATQRFDRQNGEKQHVLTATGMTGWDFKSVTHSSYENLFQLCSFLKISHAEVEELYRRMVFNVVFANTDDHMKNHSFIYNPESDRWQLSPAYDITYSANPLIDFKKLNRALSINGKRSEINRKDLLTIAEAYTIKNPKGIIEEVQAQKEILLALFKEHQVTPKVSERIGDRILTDI